ncbi:hypothetical protein Hs30E_14590 [Lactococcus hodotermopsidis]|uniref:Uncharacterized protein n=1 Tax=Pseudolactococcus hodotermopsidis TaxID=2709157 RepID=A0A6A0BEZ1_9LACT|nr:hypothetical protein [Lactococcus hodotermopsidis]GFH42908.1 hypothetical protein Hs30E_14590 [Lactococcus hodotermopsidis]
MKNVLKAYFKLRKNWLIAFYSLIVLFGVGSMVVDSVNWHSWEKVVDKNMDAYHYREIRDYLGKKTTNNAEVYNTFDNAETYLSLVSIDYSLKTDPRVSAYYAKMPEDFDVFRDQQLAYYKTTDVHYERFQAQNPKWLIYHHGNGAFDVTLNKVGMIGIPLLVFVGLYALVLIIDQWKKLPAFIRSRTGNGNLLGVSQVIYWLVIPFALASVLTVVTEITRPLFIPAKYAVVPWWDILNYSVDYFSYIFAATIFVTFVHALVGNPIYKIITGVGIVLAASIALGNLQNLLGITRFPSPFSPSGLLNAQTFLIFVAVLCLPLTIWMQTKYSLEQESAYIRIRKFSLPFYVLIVFFSIFDFIIPLFMENKGFNVVALILSVIIPIAIILIFAKLVLNKNVLTLIKK